MGDRFPIVIAETRFETVEDLAADITRRGEDCVLPERSGLDPWDWYARWMREDTSGKIEAAVLEACAVLIEHSTSGDALHPAIQLTGSRGSPATLRAIMDRIASGNMPDARWYGDHDALSKRALSTISYGVRTRIPEDTPRLVWLLEAHGEFYAAASILLTGPNPDPAVIDLVDRWARSMDIQPEEASALGSTASFYPDLVVPLAVSLSRANEDAKAAFQAQIDEHLPEKAHAVFEAIKPEHQHKET
ncbi:MAG: hypothetical protein ACE366_03440 [Bradymonadia bacterium]